jgi:hypothetical protein
MFFHWVDVFDLAPKITIPINELHQKFHKNFIKQCKTTLNTAKNNYYISRAKNLNKKHKKSSTL